MQETWIMAPYIIETAYRYNRAAESLWGIESSVAIVNAALSLEILFKSFNSEIAGNNGKLNQKYRFNQKCLKKGENKHDFIDLFNALPAEVKTKLEDRFTIDVLEKYRKAFVTERYIYEPDTKSGGGSVLISISSELIKKAVEIYKSNGCNDIWVVNYPNV